MAEGQRWGILPPYRKASFPAFPGMIAVLGPGVIFMALAQGSGELIWWPLIIAKYGLTFLFLLLPACLLQFPVIYEIVRYTTLTGESICQGFMRLNRYFALPDPLLSLVRRLCCGRRDFPRSTDGFPCWMGSTGTDPHLKGVIDGRNT